MLKVCAGREELGKKKFPNNLCPSTRPEMTNLNIKRLESKGWRKKKREKEKNWATAEP